MGRNRIKIYRTTFLRVRNVMVGQDYPGEPIMFQVQVQIKPGGKWLSTPILNNRLVNYSGFLLSDRNFFTSPVHICIHDNAIVVADEVVSVAGFLKEKGCCKVGKIKSYK